MLAFSLAEMKSTRGQRPETAPAQTRRVGVLEKPTRLGNPVELARVKLQGLPDSFSSSTSMWSAEGITRTTRLYQRSSSTPPSHPGLTSFGGLREDRKTNLLLPDHLKNALCPSEDNQVEECGTANQCNSASIGVDIQRSWSAPPTNDQVSASCFEACTDDVRAQRSVVFL